MCVPQNVTAHHIAPPIFVHIKYVSTSTTVFRYNIEPETIIHIPPIIMLSKIFPSIFPICGDTYIVQYLYCNVCHTRTLPTPGLFTIFSFFHQKTPQEFLVVSLFRLPQISLSSRWILHERNSFSYSFISKLNALSLKFFPHLDTKKI